MTENLNRYDGGSWQTVTTLNRVEIKTGEDKTLRADVICLLSEELIGCTSVCDGAVYYGKPLTAVYTHKDNFILPDAVTVTMNGAAMVQGTDYTWSSTTGSLRIPFVTGNITISVNASLHGGLYSQCDYIQSSGSQYIDTGVIGDTNTAMEATFAKLPTYPSGYWAVFGACEQDLVKSFLFAMYNDGNTKCSFEAGSNRVSDINYTFAADTQYTAKLDKRLLYINGTSIGSLTSYTYTTPVNIGIFRQIYSVSTNCSNAYMKFYGAKIWQSGVLVRRFIPCVRNSDNAAGLYDDVIGAFYPNAGTGDFSYKSSYVSCVSNTLFACSVNTHGALFIGSHAAITYTPDRNFTLPETITVKMGGTVLIQGTDFTWTPSTGELYIPHVTGDLDVTITAVLDGVSYTQCNYIESSGTQYINTGVVADQNTAMEATFAKISTYPSSWWAVFGACQQDMVSSFLFAMYNNGNTKCNIQAGTNKNSDISYTFAADTQYTAKLDKRVLYINGTSIGSLTSYTYTTPVNIGIFRQLYSVSTNCSNAYMKLYGAKIWQSGILVRCFIPCIRNLDNAPGLYDVVSGSFYGNAGTGTFRYA